MTIELLEFEMRVIFRLNTRRLIKYFLQNASVNHCLLIVIFILLHFFPFQLFHPKCQFRHILSWPVKKAVIELYLTPFEQVKNVHISG